MTDVNRFAKAKRPSESPDAPDQQRTNAAMRSPRSNASTAAGKMPEPAFVLDRDGPEPLYRQLVHGFERLIRDGTLNPGDRLPAEDALMRGHRVSRITLRQAVGELVQKGLLLRKQGKGTFVTAPTVRHDLRRLHGLLGSLFSQAETASAMLLRFETCVPPAEIGRLMKLPRGGQALAMDRLYLIGSKPVALARGFLAPAAAQLGRATADLLSTEDLLRAAGIRIGSSQVSIRAEAAGTGIGKYLKLSARAPVLVLRRHAFGDDGAAREVCHLWFRSDSYELICATPGGERVDNLFDIRNVEDATQKELKL